MIDSPSTKPACSETDGRGRANHSFGPEMPPPGDVARAATAYSERNGSEESAAFLNPTATARASSEGPEPAAPDAGGLFSAYSAQIFAYCLHNLGSRSDAEDALQTTFLQAHRALQRGVVPECESAWLTAIAKNACRWQRRSQARRATVSRSLDVAAFPAPEDVDREGAVADLKQALASIPERQRKALLLREWQGLQPSEIAPRLGASTSETYALLARARRSVASALTAAARRPVLGIDFGSLLLQLRSLVVGAPATVGATAIAIAGVGVAGMGVERAVTDRQQASTSGAVLAQRAASAASGQRAVGPVARRAVHGPRAVTGGFAPRPGMARARASRARSGGPAPSAVRRGGSPSPAATPDAAAPAPSSTLPARAASPDPAPARGTTLLPPRPASRPVPPLSDVSVPLRTDSPPAPDVVTTVTSVLATQDPAATLPPEAALPSPPLPALPAPIGS